MTARRQKRQRAEDQTTVTFSCSTELKEKIRTAAKAEHRSISNWLVHHLEQALGTAEEVRFSPPKLKRVAEEREEYKS